MRKIVLIVVPFFAATVVFVLFTFFFNSPSGKGALQITANPRSQVFINGKMAGETPLSKHEENDMLPIGEYTIKLVPIEGSFIPFEIKVPIGKSVMTVIDRTFGDGATSEGSVIYLTPLQDSHKIEVLVLSFPDNVNTLLDNNPIKTTPLLLKDITKFDHDIKLTKDGYKEKIVRIRAIEGYKLTATIFLGVKAQEQSQASQSGRLQKEATPSAKPKNIQVVILDTPPGFLRVRERASIGSNEIDRVLPGDIYEYVDESPGWYEIKLKNGKIGWVSSQYAKKQ